MDIKLARVQLPRLVEEMVDMSWDSEDFPRVASEIFKALEIIRYTKDPQDLDWLNTLAQQYFAVIPLMSIFLNSVKMMIAFHK